MRFPLSFTTLGCPAWSWAEICDRAGEYGYQGIELRGIGDEMDMTKTAPFAAGKVQETKRELADRGLGISCVDTSCRLHEPDNSAGKDEARRHIDLAAELDAKSIRVFGDKIPAGESEDAVVDRVAAGLLELGEYADGTGVSVLVESHGDFSESGPLLKLLQRAQHDSVGVLWDSHHPYRLFHEPVAQTYRDLADRIRHVHVKDSVPDGGGGSYRLPGEGDVPLAEILALLDGGGYDGWLSFEWEKRWHPEIDEPEVAFPAFVRTIRALEAAAG